MEYLKSCASRLDSGEPAESVLACMRKVYTTPKCLNVKVCKVRQLCRPTLEFEQKLEEILSRSSWSSDNKSLFESVISDGQHRRGWRRTGNHEVDVAIRELPPRISENARLLRLQMNEKRDVKQEDKLRKMEKNMVQHTIDGGQLLNIMRNLLSTSERITDLTLALLLICGRRTCEILNGRSEIQPVYETKFAMRFAGQAKQTGNSGSYVVPILCPFEDVRISFEKLRAMQKNQVLDNECTSRKYQSALGRRLKHITCDVKNVHGLRGIYACIVYQLFDWSTHSLAYVTMKILGHKSLEESLAYTPNKVEGLENEPLLGTGILTGVSE